MIYKIKMKITIKTNIGDLEIPSMIFLSSFNFLAFKKLKIYNITKVLNINVNCLDGVISIIVAFVYSGTFPSIEYNLPEIILFVPS